MNAVPAPRPPAMATVSFVARLFVVAAQGALLDLWIRGPSYLAHHPQVLVAAASSVLVWFALLSTSKRNTLRVAATGVASLLVASNGAYYVWYHGPLNAQAIATALHCWSDVRPVLKANALPLGATFLGVALVNGFLVHAKTSWALRPRWTGLSLALGLLVPLGVSAPERSPEWRLADAFAQWRNPVLSMSTDDAPVLVPDIPSAKAQLPSLLIVLTESVRASDYCGQGDGDASCSVAPRLNALLPHRIPFKQLRSPASYTAVSLAALLTGAPQMGSRQELLSAPTLFDHAYRVHSATGRPWVGFFSAHAADELEHRNIGRSLDRFVTLETLLGHDVVDDETFVDDGFDERLANHFSQQAARIPHPAVVFMQFASTHAPYFVKDESTPFQPWTHVVSWTGMASLRNAYRNAIFEQDKHIASAVKAFLDSRQGKPWAILFTSDHGEAFGEHGAIHHGQNLHEEQVHIPGFVVASDETLRPEEWALLRQHAQEPATLLDVLPTALDLLGALDFIRQWPSSARQRGRSWLRPYDGEQPTFPITNCTAIFPCPLNTWGMIGGGHVLHAKVWDEHWSCYRVGDADTEVPLTDAPCRKLMAESREPFRLMPNGRPNEAPLPSR